MEVASIFLFPAGFISNSTESVSAFQLSTPSVGVPLSSISSMAFPNLVILVLSSTSTDTSCLPESFSQGLSTSHGSLVSSSFTPADILDFDDPLNPVLHTCVLFSINRSIMFSSLLSVLLLLLLLKFRDHLSGGFSY